MIKQLALGAAFMCMLFSCADDKGEETTTTAAVHSLLPPSKVRIEQICRTYTDKDYMGYVECLHSCRNKPESYLTQMQYMLKQRFALLAKDSVEIKGLRTEQIVLHEKHNAADVYLDVAYSGGKQEEILLPMVYDDGKWWVQ